jgi:DNA-binding CsgD family transcriptional regulator
VNPYLFYNEDDVKAGKMPHFILFIIQLIFIAAVCSLFFITYRRLKTGNRLLEFIIFYIAIMALKLLLNYILLYFKINLAFESFIELILYTFSADISFLLLFSFPFIFNTLLSIPRLKLNNYFLVIILAAAFLIRCVPYFYKIFFPGEFYDINLFYLPEIITGFISIYILITYFLFHKRQEDPLKRKMISSGLVFYFYILIDTFLINQMIYLKGFYSFFIWMSMGINLFWIVFLNGLAAVIIRTCRESFSEGAGADEDFIRKYNLTSREAGIVSQVINGKSNKEIAESIFLSIKTIKNHIYKIFQKTGVRNRLELTLLAGSNKKK